jgi:hypothetical protein
MMLFSLIGGYELYSFRREVCFRTEDGSSMPLLNTYTNTQAYTKLS